MPELTPEVLFHTKVTIRFDILCIIRSLSKVPRNVHKMDGIDMFVRHLLMVTTLALCVLASACTQPTTDDAEATSPTGPTGGKGDVISENKLDEARCSYGLRWLFDTSGELEATGTTTYTIDDVDDIDPLTSSQIYGALYLNESIEGDEDFDVVFDAVDEGELYVSEVAVGAESFTWVKYYVGDTEVGALFEAGTLSPVGLISDSDILGCEAATTTFAFEPATCSYDQRWIFDGVEGLDEVGGSRVEYFVADLDEMPRRTLEQLHAATVQLEFLAGTEEDLSILFEVSDDESFIVTRLTAEGQDFDWVRFYAGDTEIGVVFEADTLNVVAEVSDGDILACSTGMSEPDPEPTTPSSYACTYDEEWLTDSSEVLFDFSENSRTYDIDSIDAISETDATLIYEAAKHLTFLDGTEDFDAVFEVADGGEYYLSDVSLEGETFRWVQFYAGDTEVGAVFNDKAILVAEVSDGDILSCQPE